MRAVRHDLGSGLSDGGARRPRADRRMHESGKHLITCIDAFHVITWLGLCLSFVLIPAPLYLWLTLLCVRCYVFVALFLRFSFADASQMPRVPQQRSLGRAERAAALRLPRLRPPRRPLLAAARHPHPHPYPYRHPCWRCCLGWPASRPHVSTIIFIVINFNLIILSIDSGFLGGSGGGGGSWSDDGRADGGRAEGARADAGRRARAFVQ